MLPLAITAKNFQKLRRWEEPYLTISFLAFAYTIIFRLDPLLGRFIMIPILSNLYSQLYHEVNQN